MSTVRIPWAVEFDFEEDLEELGAVPSRGAPTRRGSRPASSATGPARVVQGGGPQTATAAKVVPTRAVLSSGGVTKSVPTGAAPTAKLPPAAAGAVGRLLTPRLDRIARTVEESSESSRIRKELQAQRVEQEFRSYVKRRLAAILELLISEGRDPRKILEIMRRLDAPAETSAGGLGDLLGSLLPIAGTIAGTALGGPGVGSTLGGMAGQAAAGLVGGQGASAGGGGGIGSLLGGILGGGSGGAAGGGIGSLLGGLLGGGGAAAPASAAIGQLASGATGLPIDATIQTAIGAIPSAVREQVHQALNERGSEAIQKGELARTVGAEVSPKVDRVLNLLQERRRQLDQAQAARRTAEREQTRQDLTRNMRQVIDRLNRIEARLLNSSVVAGESRINILGGKGLLG